MINYQIINDSTDNQYDIVVLTNNRAFVVDKIKEFYPFDNSMIALSLPAFTKKAEMKEHSKTIKELLNKIKPKVVIVTDSGYFKHLAGVGQSDQLLGYVQAKDDINYFFGINWVRTLYDPQLVERNEFCIGKIKEFLLGSYQPPGKDIIHFEEYPNTLESIKNWLDKLMTYPELAIDIETYDLKFHKAGLASICFCWSKHEGIAFSIDEDAHTPNVPVRSILKEFLTNYKGKCVYHNASFDVRTLIYQLWMEHPLDNESMLEGLDTLTANIDDTKIIKYLATNSTAGNVLGLKPSTQEFTGKYAVENIEDVSSIPRHELLKYNLIDGLATLYLKEKYYSVMVNDNQLDIYQNLMLPSLKVIIAMELTGMPMNLDKIRETQSYLCNLREDCLNLINTHPLIKETEILLTDEEHESDYQFRKAKAQRKEKIFPKERSTYPSVMFNAGSSKHIGKLLYDVLKLPVLDLTASKSPATGGDTLKKLVNHTEEKELLNALIKLKAVDKILSAFIPSFLDGFYKSDDRIYLHGGFNIGGTVSGRLSSSSPNLQQLPSNSTYGKKIKECFQAPKGWIFAGADFSSLEDYISALTTKDPNKLGVYINGFDGHCLRAAYYFREQLPDIDLNNPKSVNSIKKVAPHLRQESKTPTFALTYAGTYMTLMANLGWSEEKAKSVESAYHELYKVSDAYVQERLKQASKDGYADVAFGLRIRTPLLSQVIYGEGSIPYEAAAEGRTVGNALGQSYGLLNNRAAVDFMDKVWKSKYRNDIKIVALVHDAIYLMIRDDIEVVEFANNELIRSMEWQELPEIQHDQVKIGAALDLFYPNWSSPITLDNYCSQERIRELVSEHLKNVQPSAVCDNNQKG